MRVFLTSSWSTVLSGSTGRYPRVCTVSCLGLSCTQGAEIGYICRELPRWSQLKCVHMYLILCTHPSTLRAHVYASLPVSQDAADTTCSTVYESLADRASGHPSWLWLFSHDCRMSFIADPRNKVFCRGRNVAEIYSESQQQVLAVSGTSEQRRGVHQIMACFPSTLASHNEKTTREGGDMAWRSSTPSTWDERISLEVRSTLSCGRSPGGVELEV